MKKTLLSAKRNRADEFYTQAPDIEAEMRCHEACFKGKSVLCNCNDPPEGAFFQYFSANFTRLGLKKLTTTFREKSASATGGFNAYKAETTGGAAAVRALSGDGDFRSAECAALLREADIVAGNPPFSLFREYVAQLMEHGKKFIILGNVNAATCKDIFPLIAQNRMRFGASIRSGDREFRVPADYPLDAYGCRVDTRGVKHIRVKGVRWFTNLDTPARRGFLRLDKRRTPDAHPRYDGCDAVNVDRVADIPADWDGVMGVPVTFLDKHNPEQFEIIGLDRYAEINPRCGRRLTINGRETYARILIRKKRGSAMMDAAAAPAYNHRVMNDKKYSIGLDYGTNSVRALVVSLSDGAEVASAVHAYKSGADGVITSDSEPLLARQNPADYIEGFHDTVKAALAAAAAADSGFAPERVAGLGVDSTGSTPIPVDASGLPLAFDRRFAGNPAAMAWLWKDHTAHREAALFTEAARAAGAPYLFKCGGVYSAEWFWAKLWRCLNADAEVFDAAFSWVELCDFIPAYLCGNLNPLTLRRGICAAGHKAAFSAEWGGLPSEEFLRGLSPKLAALRSRLYSQALPSNHPAGRLHPDIARKCGLPPGIAVAVGAFDCHHGAVGSGVKPGTLVKILGTSSCDVMVSEKPLPDIPGVCGVVPGSVIPGMLGVEAGQSAVGDIFKWFVDKHLPQQYAGGNPYENLEREAERLRPGESGLLALDWHNGNRTVLVDPLLSGLLIGQTLGTAAPEIHRALVEATAFGALAIIRRVEGCGLEIREVVTGGGLAEKSPMLMRIYADVLDRPVKTARSTQTCALGAAMFGAVAAGEFGGDISAAQNAMCGAPARVYEPSPANARVYARLFALYQKLHDSFGVPGAAQDLSGVMKELIKIRSEARNG